MSRIEPSMDTPNPGSPEAIKRGCICPVIDNGHGAGYLGGVKDPETGETVFVWRADCPLHGIAPNAARIEARVKELEAKLAQSGLAFEDQARELENAVGLLEELGPEHALEFRRRTYPDLYPRP